VDELPARAPVVDWNVIAANVAPTGDKVLTPKVSDNVAVAKDMVTFEGNVTCRLVVERWAVYEVVKKYPNCWPVLDWLSVFDTVVRRKVIDPQGHVPHDGVEDSEIDLGYRAEDVPGDMRVDLGGKYLDVSFKGQKPCRIKWLIPALGAGNVAGEEWVNEFGYFRVDLPVSVIRMVSELPANSVSIEFECISSDDKVRSEKALLLVDRQKFVGAL
jgi:hypothetical protein